MVRRAAALVVGNEILTGKVADANVQRLARALFRSGIRLERVVICRDDVAAIARDLDAMRAEHEFVFTSGGVGPTHDDVTVPAIARCFGVALRRDAELERRIRDHFGAATTEGHLRMADVPEGAELFVGERVGGWPVLVMGNVFVLPGVPEIFARKLDAILPRLGPTEPFVSAAVYTRCDEGTIAALLERIERDHGVSVGSYPRFDDHGHTVKITFDGTEAAAVAAALEDCVAGIAPDLVVRIERASTGTGV